MQAGETGRRQRQGEISGYTFNTTSPLCVDGVQEAVELTLCTSITPSSAPLQPLTAPLEEAVRLGEQIQRFHTSLVRKRNSWNLISESNFLHNAQIPGDTDTLDGARPDVQQWRRNQGDYIPSVTFHNSILGRYVCFVALKSLFCILMVLTGSVFISSASVTC